MLNTLLETVQYIPYMGKHPQGKILYFEWNIAIHSKTFTVAFLYTCISTDQQGIYMHNPQEKIHSLV